ncbi:MAG: ABC transporter ATP-binding protein [archaeon]|nr:ABC transporter ATP-binding protein [archaeon]
MDSVHIRDLRKSYDGKEAVKGISFDVPEGSFFAFLGPNGAGKSTTIKIISSLLEQDSGEVGIFGKEPSSPEAKKDIGVVFQDPRMDGVLTVRENISVKGAFYGMDGKELEDAVDRSLELTGCSEFADRRYGKLSGGQRRRADIARALVHSPRLLILDEPTTGLDPKTRVMIWDLIDGLNREKGLTVLLTTHYMEEAEGADMIVIVDHGEIVARGTPQELRDRHCSDRLTFVPKDLERAEKTLSLNGVRYTVGKDGITVPLGRTADSVPVIALIGDNVESIEVRTGTLDEAFIDITGRDGE